MIGGGTQISVDSFYPPCPTSDHLSVPHRGIECRPGFCHPPHIVTTPRSGLPVPARAVGGCEGVSAAVRKENLTDLRTRGHHLALSAVRLGKATVGHAGSFWLLETRALGHRELWF